MTVVETRTEVRTVFEGRARRWAAAWLLLGPLVMIASFGMATLLERRGLRVHRRVGVHAPLEDAAHPVGHAQR